MSAALLWARLERAQRCTLRATAALATPSPWRRQGEGVVRLLAKGTHRLEWEESGSGSEEGGRPVPDRNGLRWVRDGTSPLIRLDHLRRGPEHPTHLADLEPVGADRFASAAPHDCAPDLYRAELRITHDGLELGWQVTGPAKSYTLLSSYSS